MGRDILHIITSNSFFNKMVIESFDRIFPHNNEYLFCGSYEDSDVKFDNVKYISFFSKEFNSLELSKYKIIVIHHLNFYKAKLINKLPDNVLVVWICWGGDAFDLPCFKNQFYTKSTISHFRLVILKEKFIQSLKSIHKSVIYRTNKNKEIYKAIERFNYIATLLPGDYELITQKLSTNAKHLNFNYYNTEVLLNNQNSSSVLSNNIIIGNSSTLTNNHIDVINILKNKKNSFGELIVPLVYGDTLYRGMLIKQFNKHFSGKTRFITKALSSDEYYSMLKTCGFAIMNHLRQQALGNILPLIGFGTKVFFNENGQLFDYLSKNGFVVFTIQNDLTQDNAFEPLTKDQILNNRNCLQKIRSAKNYFQNMNEFQSIL
jgi:dTDP-N-acetylfucosamine:lipid II N-acetylfucosaminyltransferase